MYTISQNTYNQSCITTVQFREYCRLDGFDCTDSELATYLLLAEQYVFKNTKQSVTLNTFKITLKQFSKYNQANSPYATRSNLVEIPVYPVVDVLSIKYYDTDSILIELPNTLYRLDSNTKPCNLRPQRDKVWPQVDFNLQDAISIEVTAGYTAENIPAMLKVLTMYIARLFYENRAPQDVVEMPQHMQNALNKFKIMGFVN